MKNEEWMITQLDDGGGKKKMLAPKNIIKGKQLDTSFEKHKKVATIDVKKDVEDNSWCSEVGKIKK
jgi:hypothetical protein